METKKITQDEFKHALKIIQDYKVQNSKPNEIKKTVVEKVLEMDEEKIKKLLDFIFKENEFLKYAIVVNRMYFFLNNKLLMKIGERNVKTVFQEYLKSDLIKSKGVVVSSFNVYFKN